MDLLVAREPSTDGVTAGHLFVEGKFIGLFTLERTAVQIPTGRYPVTLTLSQRFGRVLPLVNNVPGRSGIRIHPFNAAKQSDGCIGCGLALAEHLLEHSKAAQDVVQQIIAQSLAHGDEVWLTVQDAMPEKKAVNA